MRGRLRVGITFVALTAAGCAGQPLNPAAGGTAPPAPAIDAASVRTLAGDPVTSRYGVAATGRDWNCPRCYK